MYHHGYDRFWTVGKVSVQTLYTHAHARVVTLWTLNLVVLATPLRVGQTAWATYMHVCAVAWMVTLILAPLERRIYRSTYRTGMIKNSPPRLSLRSRLGGLLWKPRVSRACGAIRASRLPLAFAHCTTVLTNPEPCKLVVAVHLLGHSNTANLGPLLAALKPPLCCCVNNFYTVTYGLSWLLFYCKPGAFCFCSCAQLQLRK